MEASVLLYSTFSKFTAIKQIYYRKFDYLCTVECNMKMIRLHYSLIIINH
jgi:hypothetical protein